MPSDLGGLHKNRCADDDPHHHRGGLHQPHRAAEGAHFFLANRSMPRLASSVMRAIAFACTPASIAASKLIASVWYSRFFDSASADTDFSASERTNSSTPVSKPASGSTRLIRPNSSAC